MERAQGGGVSAGQAAVMALQVRHLNPQSFECKLRMPICSEHFRTRGEAERDCGRDGEPAQQRDEPVAADRQAGGKDGEEEVVQFLIESAGRSIYV